MGFVDGDSGGVHDFVLDSLINVTVNTFANDGGLIYSYAGVLGGVWVLEDSKRLSWPRREPWTLLRPQHRRTLDA
jgi:hypothetical protein